MFRKRRSTTTSEGSVHQAHANQRRIKKMTNAYIVNLRNLSIVADSEEEAKEKMLENIKEAIRKLGLY